VKRFPDNGELCFGARVSAFKPRMRTDRNNALIPSRAAAAAVRMRVQFKLRREIWREA